MKCAVEKERAENGQRGGLLPRVYHTETAKSAFIDLARRLEMLSLSSACCGIKTCYNSVS